MSEINETVLFDFLKAHHIDYQLYKHQPVFTTQDQPIGPTGEKITMPGIHSKNLFLVDKKNNTFFLVSVTQDKRVDLKALSAILGCSRFSFGKPEELLALLKIQPGSVTPFGLMFDQPPKVTFVLDEDFLSGEPINFHPLRNDMNIGMMPQDFLTCMEKMGHQPRIIKIPMQ